MREWRLLAEALDRPAAERECRGRGAAAGPRGRGGLARLDAAGARRALDEARAIYEEKFPLRTPEYADVMIGLGRPLLRNGSRWAAEAASWLGRARAAGGR